MIPKRKKKPKMGLREPTAIKCAGHLQWVRGHECCVWGKLEQLGDGYARHHSCEGKTEAHHVVSRGAGGGDEQVVPLCSKAHADGHRMGWETFQKRYRVDLASTAADMWKQSPAGKRYRMTQVGSSGARRSGDEVQK